MTVDVRLGEVQETLLGTLYARATESRKKNGMIYDPKAVEMVESIDYDFSVFGGSPMQGGAVLRTLILDHWVRGFIAAHPTGTVVEIGAGLSSRFDRVDNGTVHWVDLDLPDSIALRRRFFAESRRGRAVAASVLDETWIEPVKVGPGPYFFIAEGVLPYFAESEARRALRGIARHFPGAHLALDTTGRWLVEHQNAPIFKKRLSATFRWVCDDPRELEGWDAGLRLRESRTLLEFPREVWGRFSLAQRCVLSAIRLVYGRRADVCRVNLFSIDGG